MYNEVQKTLGLLNLWLHIRIENVLRNRPEVQVSSLR